MPIRIVTLFLLLLLVHGGAWGLPKVSHGAFTSGGKAIHYTWYQANRSGPSPVVILLHGSGGALGNVGWMSHYGEMLAERGFHVVTVNYMERTGHAFVTGLPTMYANFRAWMEVVADSITLASRKPGVDGRRVGLVGLSLGAYLALSTARRDPRVKAVVEYFGGLPTQMRTGRGPMPPILILHGTSDPVVPVNEAFSLMAYLEQLKSPHESRVYPNEGHGFSPPIQRDSESHALGFLERYLKPGVQSTGRNAAGRRR